MAIIIRAAIVYVILLFTLRVIGRRAVNKMTPFELILLFLIGGLGIQSIVTNDRSLTGALTGIITVGSMHVLTAWIKQRHPRVARILDGTPIVIVEDGNWHEERMDKMRLQREDVAASARSQGLVTLDKVEYAVVERDGTISVFPKEEG